MKHHLLNISSINCRFEAFVNDVLVVGSHSGDSLSFEIPVNHLVRERENSVVARVLPPPGLDAVEANSRMHVTVYAIEEGAWNEADTRTRVAEIQTDSFRIPGVDALPLIEAAGAFLALDASPLPWEESPEWRIEKRDLDLAEATYARLHELLARRDTDGVINMMREKCESCARAYGTSTLEFTDYVRKSIDELVGDPDLRLRPLATQQFRPRIFGGGRLVSAFNEHSKPLLSFHNPKLDETTYLDVFIMKDPNGRAVVIR
jgi:hypothetical protein